MENSETHYSAMHVNAHWLTSSSISLVWLGFGNFITGKYSYNPFTVKVINSSAFLIFGVICVISFYTNFSYKYKRLPKFPETTIVYTVKEGKSKLVPGVFIAASGGLFTFLGQISSYLAIT